MNKLTEHYIDLINSSAPSPNTLTQILNNINDSCNKGLISPLDQGTLQGCIQHRASKMLRGVLAGIKNYERTTPTMFQGIVNLWQGYSDINMLSVEDASDIRKDILYVLDLSPHRGIGFRV